MAGKDRNIEILELSQEIITDIELEQIPLGSILLKCARLARLTGNANAITLFNCELGGYSRNEDGFVYPEIFELSRNVNRVFRKKGKSDKYEEYLFSETVAELEAQLKSAHEQMAVAYDVNVSITSANPNQRIIAPSGNAVERSRLMTLITTASERLSKLKNGYYKYALDVYSKWKYEDIAEDIFKKKQVFVNNKLAEIAPESINKFVAAYENLKSSNSEDWANAVHSCRRILKDVADVLYPASDKEIDIGGGNKMKLGDEKYIARLKQYIIEHTDSENFEKVVGSQLEFIGDRLDALYKATTKGTHDKVEQEESERYVIYTYLLLADVLSL